MIINLRDQIETNLTNQYKLILSNQEIIQDDKIQDK